MQAHPRLPLNKDSLHSDVFWPSRVSDDSDTEWVPDTHACCHDRVTPPCSDSTRASASALFDLMGLPRRCFITHQSTAGGVNRSHIMRRCLMKSQELMNRLEWHWNIPLGGLNLDTCRNQDWMCGTEHRMMDRSNGICLIPTEANLSFFYLHAKNRESRKTFMRDADENEYRLLPMGTDEQNAVITVLDESNPDGGILHRYPWNGIVAKSHVASRFAVAEAGYKLQWHIRKNVLRKRSLEQQDESSAQVSSSATHHLASSSESEQRLSPVHHDPSPSPTHHDPSPVHHDPSPFPTHHDPSPVHHDPSPSPSPTHHDPSPVHHDPSPSPTHHDPSPVHHDPSPAHQDSSFEQHDEYWYDHREELADLLKLDGWKENATIWEQIDLIWRAWTTLPVDDPEYNEWKDPPHSLHPPEGPDDDDLLPPRKKPRNNRRGSKKGNSARGRSHRKGSTTNKSRVAAPPKLCDHLRQLNYLNSYGVMWNRQTIHRWSAKVAKDALSRDCSGGKDL